jgi:hypothetical protein
VDHLEQYVSAQRERLREAATALQELVDRVPAGLGEMRRPLLSASDETGETANVASAGDDSEYEDDPVPEEDRFPHDPEDIGTHGAAPGTSDRTPVSSDLMFRPGSS